MKYYLGSQNADRENKGKYQFVLFKQRSTYIPVNVVRKIIIQNGYSLVNVI